MKGLLFAVGVLLLFAIEILRVYFIMPFPGSQHADTIGLAYFIDNHRVLLRVVGALLVIFPLLSYWNMGRWWRKALLGVLVLFYGVVFYFFNFRFEADKMFIQPGVKRFALAADNKIGPDKLVIGVVAGGEARAYPIQLIGYHHQVRDTIGGVPVIVTYCTVCRTGRVYSPVVNGKLEQFRLVGMDHFNAMFEDASTHSWWQQATGVAIAGPLRDSRLAEIPSSQASLATWLQQHPDSKIMQPDTTFNKQYEDLADYDKGTIKGGLEKRDSGLWKAKSWVVGVIAGGYSKAYDWNMLIDRRRIEDTIGAVPVVVVLGDDSVSFNAWAKQADGELRPLPAYQEFWHSWSNFHPGTTRYMP